MSFQDNFTYKSYFNSQYGENNILLSTVPITIYIGCIAAKCALHLFKATSRYTDFSFSSFNNNNNEKKYNGQ